MGRSNLPPGVSPSDIPPTEDTAVYENFLDDFTVTIGEDEDCDPDRIEARWKSQPLLVAAADLVIDFYNMDTREFVEMYGTGIGTRAMCNALRAALAEGGHPRVDHGGNERTVHVKCPGCTKVVELVVVRCEDFLDKKYDRLAHSKCPECGVDFIVFKNERVVEAYHLMQTEGEDS